MKLLIIASTLLAMFSCAAEKNDDDTGDTYEIEAQGTYKSSEALLTHISTTLPYFTWKEIFLVSNPQKTDPCPSVEPTADGKGFIVTGNCTDLRGVDFTGRFLINSTEFTGRINYDFESFSMLKDVRFVELNGQIQFDLESDILTNNVNIHMEDGGHNITLKASYTDHTFGPLLDAGEVLNKRAGKFASLGTVEIEEIDRFVLDGRFEHTNQCESESDNTVLVFTGERGTLTFTDSAESCDGCTEWTDGTASGKICALQ